jgi:methylglutaconyl-CoA hydratase
MGGVEVERHPNGCVTLTFRNPGRRNALDDGMLNDLVAELPRLAGDPHCRILVFNGEGQDFCSGRDISGTDIDRRTDDDLRSDFRRLRSLASLVDAFPKPTLAVVRGYALGLGAAIVGWADMAYAATDAKFGFPEVKVGIPPSFTTLSLVRRVGRKAAMPLLLTGAMIDGSEAERIALITRALPAGELDGAVEALIQQATDASQTAIALCKDLIRSTEGQEWSDALDQAIETTIRGARTEDAREGRAAFREKRKPRWASRA